MKRIKFENIFLMFWGGFTISCIVSHMPTFSNLLFETMLYSAFGYVGYLTIKGIRKGDL